MIHGHQGSRDTRFDLVVVLTLVVANATLCQGQELARAVHVTAENDHFNFWQPPQQRSDDNYSQGVRLGWDVVGAPSVARRVICGRSVSCASTLEFGQEMYTPTLDAATPIPGQRPYAGWLYVRGGVVAATARTHRAVDATFGVTGRASLAGQIQEIAHSFYPRFHQPLGWSHQLPSEPDFAVQFRQSWYLGSSGAGAHWADVVPEAYATIGTLRTALGGGGQLRIGFDVDHPWLVDAPARPLAVFLFLGARGEAVGRDLFLDGSTFHRSGSVPRVPFISDWERGVDFRLWRLGAEYRAITQGREYRPGPGTHTYSGITVTWWTVR